MSRTFLRRLISASAAVLVVGVVGAGSAFASSTLPANNPIDYAEMQKGGFAQAFVVKVKGSKMEGAAFSSKVSTKPVSNVVFAGTITYAAKIAVSKGVTRDGMIVQTITITANCGTTTKCALAGAFATLSGGNSGSGVIIGTKMATNRSSYVITMLFDEQGTNPNLNIKFYLYQL